MPRTPQDATVDVKATESQATLRMQGQASNFCPNAHDPKNPYDRKCHLLDGRPKRWYLVRSNAKAASNKNQGVYACPSGSGFHIGR